MSFKAPHVTAKLSKSILEMKFMKKSKEKAVKDLEDEEGKAMFASEVTKAMLIGGTKFIIEPSFVPCEDLLMGRFSFHGMNPEIERLLEIEEEAKRPKSPDNPADVDDEEMAARYSTLVGTIHKKFVKKEKVLASDGPARKKPKFMKPTDD